MAVCPSPGILPGTFWQEGGTFIGEDAFTKVTDDPDEVRSAAISFEFDDRAGGVYLFRGSVRSDYTGISMAIVDGKLAPVVQVQAGETTEVE